MWIMNAIMMILFVLFMIFILGGYHKSKYEKREKDELKD